MSLREELPGTSADEPVGRLRAIVRSDAPFLQRQLELFMSASGARRCDLSVSSGESELTLLTAGGDGEGDAGRQSVPWTVEQPGEALVGSLEFTLPRDTAVSSELMRDFATHIAGSLRDALERLRRECLDAARAALQEADARVGADFLNWAVSDMRERLDAECVQLVRTSGKLTRVMRAASIVRRTGDRLRHHHDPLTTGEPGLCVVTVAAGQDKELTLNILGARNEVVSAADLAGLYAERLRVEVGRERAITELFAKVTGVGDGAEDFCARVAEALGRVMRVSVAIVGRHARPGSADTQTLAMWSSSGNIVHREDYTLAGTPCEVVARQGFAFFETGLQQVFPDDASLRELGVDSYFGVSCPGVDGTSVGHVAIMDSRPIRVALVLEHLIRFVAARVGIAIDPVRPLAGAVNSAKLEQRLVATHYSETLQLVADGVAHDFGNMLLAILGNADLAAAELPPDSPVQEYLRDIRAVAHRAGELAQQLRTHIGSVRTVGETDLQTLAEETVRLMRGGLSVGVEFEEADEPLFVAHDPTRLRQVIANLLTNASDASAEASSKDPIRVSCMPKDDGASIEVVDSGRGMTPAQVEKVFTPGFSTKGSGRGLGMTVVRFMIRQFGGSIEFDTAPGRGTRVHVWLPRR